MNRCWDCLADVVDERGEFADEAGAGDDVVFAAAHAKISLKQSVKHANKLAVFSGHAIANGHIFVNMDIGFVSDLEGLAYDRLHAICEDKDSLDADIVFVNRRNLIIAFFDVVKEIAVEMNMVAKLRRLLALLGFFSLNKMIDHRLVHDIAIIIKRVVAKVFCHFVFAKAKVFSHFVFVLSLSLYHNPQIQ